MNNQEYNLLINSVEKWLKEKKDYDLNRNKVFGLNPKFYLLLFAILFTYIYFIKDLEFSKNEPLNNIGFASNYILYEKPDNKSKIILQNESKTELKIIDETKFYYQVEFSNQGENYFGYINKENIVK